MFISVLAWCRSNEAFALRKLDSTCCAPARIVYWRISLQTCLERNNSEYCSSY